jgi:hypothetical protein
MSRPKPTVIANHQHGDLCYEVCEADAVYAVLYQGQPIKVRTHNPDVKYMGFKYGKSMFPEPGHAVRLAKKLNEIHNTDAFTVAVMIQGRSIPL